MNLNKCFTFSLQRGQFYKFQLNETPREEKSAPVQTSLHKGDSEGRLLFQKLRYFKKVPEKEIFLYSAITNNKEPVEGDVNIIITAFDSTGNIMNLSIKVRKR